MYVGGLKNGAALRPCLAFFAPTFPGYPDGGLHRAAPVLQGGISPPPLAAMTARCTRPSDLSILATLRSMCRDAETDPQKAGRVTLKMMTDRIQQSFGLDLPSGAQAGPLKRFLASGQLLRCHVLEDIDGRGPSHTFRVADLDPTHLGSLLHMARAHVSDEVTARPGRRATADAAGSREIWTVTRRQLAMIETATRKLVLELVPPSRPQSDDTAEEKEARLAKGLARIGLPLLVWSDGAGPHAHGDWAILETADAAFRTLNRNTRHRYIGALRTLLDLAATHGFLVRREVHGASHRLPEDWSEVLEEWDRRIREVRPGRAILTSHLTRLLLLLGESHHPETVDPLQLTEAQSSRFLQHVDAVVRASRSLRKHHRVELNSLLRGLIDSGIVKGDRDRVVDLRRSPQRKNAFSTANYLAIAREFCSRSRSTDANYGLFRALGRGAFFDPESAYGLPRLIDWFTIVRLSERKRRDMSAIAAFPTSKVRGTGGLSGRPWTEPTITVHLELLGMYLGYLARHHALDLDGPADARTIFTQENVDAFTRAVDEGWTTAHRGLDILYHIGMYCSPCLEESARKAGESVQADAFRDLADYIAGRGSLGATGWDGTTLHSSLRQEWAQDQDAIERQRRRAQAVQACYERAMGVDYAYIGQVQLRNAMIRRLCREFASPDLDTLRTRIEEGSRPLTPSEFHRIRDVQAWADALAAPLRRRTVSLLDPSEFQEGAGGKLTICVPGTKMKVPRNGDYQLLIGIRDPGTAHEMRYRFDLRDLYVAARAHLGLQDAPWICQPDGRPLAPESISYLYGRTLRYGAEELGVDPDPILRQDGVASSHAFRHAAATYMVAHGHLDLARRMLHHKGLDTILKVYSAGGSDQSAERALMGPQPPG